MTPLAFVRELFNGLTGGPGILRDEMPAWAWIGLTVLAAGLYAWGSMLTGWTGPVAPGWRLLP